MAEDVNQNKIFGILNLSPDSFSDGSLENLEIHLTLKKASELFKAGADVIDIGAESTRPGAAEISPEEECKRLLPFLEIYKKTIFCPVSIDTRKAQVVFEALKYDVDYINDVSGLQGDPDLIKAVSKSDKCKVIVMHSKGGIPALASKEISDDFYDGEEGLYQELIEFFSKSIEIAQKYGVVKERLILDPGLGFGKNAKHSFDILALIPLLKEKFNLPILIGASRKSFLSARYKISDSFSLDDATFEYNLIALKNGANIFRVHDVTMAKKAQAMIKLTGWLS